MAISCQKFEHFLADQTTWFKIIDEISRNLGTLIVLEVLVNHPSKCGGRIGWVNHWNASYMRCHRAHYDVIVTMLIRTKHLRLLFEFFFRHRWREKLTPRPEWSLSCHPHLMLHRRRWYTITKNYNYRKVRLLPLQSKIMCTLKSTE